jgi:hypothetical protein
MATRMASTLRGIQRHHSQPLYNVTISFSSCDVAQVKGTYLRFRKILTNTFQRHIPNCLVIGEYELAPTVIWSIDSGSHRDPDEPFAEVWNDVVTNVEERAQTLAEQECGAGSRTIIPSAPIRYGVIVHCHFNLLPYREPMSEDSIHEVFHGAFVVPQLANFASGRRTLAGVYTEENAGPIIEQVAGYVLTLPNVVAAIPVRPIVGTIVAAAHMPAVEKVFRHRPAGGAADDPDQAPTIVRPTGRRDNRMPFDPDRRRLGCPAAQFLLRGRGGSGSPASRARCPSR